MTDRPNICVFIVDDHALFREGLIRLLERDSAIQVTGSAGESDEALKKLLVTPVDVLILDYDLGKDTALTLLRQLHERDIKVKSLLVTAGVPNGDALEIIRMGVSGIFPKQRPPEELHRSILEVASGKVVLDQAHFQRLVDSVGASREKIKLTDRDKKVLALLLEGQSNKEIAGVLHLSESAVKAALQQLFAKTGVRTRSQLVRIALEELRDEL